MNQHVKFKFIWDSLEKSSHRWFFYIPASVNGMAHGGNQQQALLTHHRLAQEQTMISRQPELSTQDRFTQVSQGQMTSRPQATMARSTASQPAAFVPAPTFSAPGAQPINFYDCNFIIIQGGESVYAQQIGRGYRMFAKPN